MGAIGGLVGLGGGAGGSSFAGPQSANLIQPTNAGQIGTAYQGVQGGMQGQQALLSALQSQNGLQNQSQVYGQLQGVASGAVNPAQAQFNQNTQQNVANQASLMAGQRGASANAGLIARQAAQQGAATQQQAVGQEATQQAQNQINAMGAAGNLATTQAGQQIGQTNANVSAQQAEQSNLLNALQGYNSNQVAMQSNVNTANAGLANTQMQGQQGLVGGVMNGVGGILGLAPGGEVKKMADGGWTKAGPTVGGGSDMPASDPSRQPLQFAPGDPYNVQQPAVVTAQPQAAQGPSSMFGKFLKGVSSQKQASDGVQQPTAGAGAGALQGGMSSLIGGIANQLKGSPSSQGVTATGGAPQTDSAVTGAPSSPDQSGIVDGGAAGSAQSMNYSKGGMTRDFRAGGKVTAESPKEKAVKKGNDYANDKIPAVLSEHEIVLPRDVTLSKDPVREAAKFVSGVIAKRKGRK